MLDIEVHLSHLDISILVVGFLAVLAVGILTGRGNRSVDDYLLANQNLPWWALLGSMVATETSTATFLSVPGFSYRHDGDLRLLQLTMGFIIGRFLVAWWLLPSYYHQHQLTVYQGLRRRFGTQTQRLASAIFLFTRNLGDGLRLYLAALALHKALGWSLGMSILGIGLLTLIYTCFGGMRSVVWNDCLQFLIYLLAAIMTLFVLHDKLHQGWTQVFEFARHTNRLRLLDTDWNLSNPYSLWAGLLGGACISLGTHGADQMIVQRSLAARSLRDATLAMCCSGVVVFAQFLLFLLIGIGLAAYNSQRFFWLELSPDEAYITFIVHELPSGILGITLLGVLSASMSTLSSSLNASASVVVGDFGWSLPRHIVGNNSDLASARIFTVIFGVVQMLLAWVAPRFSESVVVDSLSLAGLTSGILFGVMLLNISRGRISPPAVRFGICFGVLSVVVLRVLPHSFWESWFGFGDQPLAWPWFSVVGTLCTVLGTKMINQCMEYRSLAEEHG